MVQPKCDYLAVFFLHLYRVFVHANYFCILVFTYIYGFFLLQPSHPRRTRRAIRIPAPARRARPPTRRTTTRRPARPSPTRTPTRPPQQPQPRPTKVSPAWVVMRLRSRALGPGRYLSGVIKSEYCVCARCLFVVQGLFISRHRSQRPACAPGPVVLCLWQSKGTVYRAWRAAAVLACPCCVPAVLAPRVGPVPRTGRVLSERAYISYSPVTSL